MTDVAEYFLSIEELVQRDELGAWNEIAIQLMLKRKESLIYGYDIKKLPWFEIDTKQDYENARSLFNN